MGFLELIFYLLCGHALADFSLQTDAMAKGKNRNRKIDPKVLSKQSPKFMLVVELILFAFREAVGGFNNIVTAFDRKLVKGIPTDRAADMS